MDHFPNLSHFPPSFQDASQWTNITDAQRKDSVDTRDFLLQRPRRESNSSGGLSETESQAELWFKQFTNQNIGFFMGFIWKIP